MRAVMVCCVSLLVALTGCAFDAAEDLDTEAEIAEADGVPDLESAPSEEELAAAEGDEAAGVVEPTPAEEEVIDGETAEADGVADPETAALRHHCRDHTTFAACRDCPYGCRWRTEWWGDFCQHD